MVVERRPARWLLLASAGLIACNLLTPARGAPTAAVTPVAVSSASPSAPPSAPPSASPSAELPAATDTAQAAVTPTDAATDTPTATAAATPTEARLQLEVVQSQIWNDQFGKLRVNFLLRNPYSFPVAPAFQSSANALNAAGKLVRSTGLYYLDGISGGEGFLMPGDTIAANACFDCETTPLPEPWQTIEFQSGVKNATGEFKISTEVTGTVGSISFEAGKSIFWLTGTAKNNSASALSRISVRVFVFDADGKLTGAAEMDASNVAPGAAVSVRNYGLGQPPKGRYTYTFTVLGVDYSQ